MTMIENLDQASRPTRREFTRDALRSLTAVALIEGLAAQRLLGKDVQPLIDAWFHELHAISKDVADHKTRDVEFQKALEALYGRVDLAALLRTLDFDRMAAGVNFPAVGARSLEPNFSRVSGLPKPLVFGRQIFAMARGRSVIPHGHDNMATGFLVLKGTLRGRHWDRVEDHKDHYLIRPTIDRAVPARRVLNRFRPSRQRSLVHRAVRSCFHLQYPRRRQRRRQPEEPCAGLHRPARRKGCRWPDQGPEDYLRQSQRDVRLTEFFAVS